MPWYYVGPDARPVGPVTLPELQERRSSGAIAPETYVIEAPAQNGPSEWKRYAEVFAAESPLPPLPVTLAPLVPPTTAAAVAHPLFPSATAAPTVPHPLFPSTAPATPSPGGPVFTGVHPSAYRLPASHVNPWCAWGFGLGVASLPLLACGFGILLAPIGLIACIVGLIQVHNRPEQRGGGLAIGGIAAALVALVLALVVIISLAASNFHSSLQMTTEQTANDSDSR